MFEELRDLILTDFIRVFAETKVAIVAMGLEFTLFHLSVEQHARVQ